MVGAWLVGLGTVVGMGLLGGSPEGGESTSRGGASPSLADVASVASQTASTVAAASAPAVLAAPRLLVLDAPARPDTVVTTRDLVIRGHLTGTVGRVAVILESSGSKPVAMHSLDGEPHFQVAIPLSNPRPGGTMTIQVVAYDADGIPVDVVRRRIIVGPVVRTVGGEDGLVGGIVFDTNTVSTP